MKPQRWRKVFWSDTVRGPISFWKERLAGLANVCEPQDRESPRKAAVWSFAVYNIYTSSHQFSGYNRTSSNKYYKSSFFFFLSLSLLYVNIGGYMTFPKMMGTLPASFLSGTVCNELDQGGVADEPTEPTEQLGDRWAEGGGFTDQLVQGGDHPPFFQRSL